MNHEISIINLKKSLFVKLFKILRLIFDYRALQDFLKLSGLFLIAEYTA